MEKRIAILNNYADEPISGPSASYFKEFITNSELINVCHGEKIDNINKYSAYIISGSRSSHKDEYDWLKYLKELIKELYKNKVPCLAVCFGHQLVADIFEGTTIIKSNGEEGFQDVPTKSTNIKPKIFNTLPNPVKIYQSHNDAVMEAPPKAVNIIKNEKCVQYFELGSIYSIQSHPEISVSNAINIAKRDNQNIDEILNDVTKESIKAHLVLVNFVNLI